MAIRTESGADIPHQAVRPVVLTFPAAPLAVEGKLTGENGRVEMGETIIDYVPSHSYRQGGLFFSQDPRKYPLQLRAKGYAAP